MKGSKNRKCLKKKQTLIELTLNIFLIKINSRKKTSFLPQLTSFRYTLFSDKVYFRSKLYFRYLVCLSLMCGSRNTFYSQILFTGTRSYSPFLGNFSLQVDQLNIFFSGTLFLSLWTSIVQKQASIPLSIVLLPQKFPFFNTSELLQWFAHTQTLQASKTHFRSWRFIFIQGQDNNVLHHRKSK